MQNTSTIQKNTHPKRWTHALAIVAVLAYITNHIADARSSFTLDGFFEHYSWIDPIQATTVWALPVLVMLIGYLCMQLDDIHAYIKEHDTIYILRLELWIILYILFLAAEFYFGRQDATISTTFQKIYDFGLKLTPFFHLRYLCMLIFLFLLAPYLKAAMNTKRSKRLIYFVVGVTIIIHITGGIHFKNGYTQLVGLFLRYIGYFMLGAYMQGKRLSRNDSLYAIAIGLLLPILNSILLDISPSFEPNTFSTLFLSIGVFSLFQNHAFSRLGRLSPYALPMYLIFPAVEWVVYLLIKDYIFLNYLRVLVITTVTVAISGEISYRLVKIFPHLGDTSFLDKEVKEEAFDRDSFIKTLWCGENVSATDENNNFKE